MARTPLVSPPAVHGNGSSRTGMTAPPPRRVGSRNRARVTGGVLLLALSALAAALVYGDLGNRRAVLAVARPVAAGSVIQNEDLTEVRVAADPGVSVVTAGERPRVVGRTAKAALVPGSLLAAGQTGSGPSLAPGSTLVGATLKPGQFPVGMREGDRILVVVMPPEVAPESLDGTPAGAVSASVVAIDAVRDSGGTISVSLAVPSGNAAELAIGGARGRLVVLVESQ